jgi:hypothetical protein
MLHGPALVSRLGRGIGLSRRLDESDRASDAAEHPLAVRGVPEIRALG